ncbi:MAG: hypothetical protein HZB47_09515 [Nitrosomonadales bacterium]|nr:hypothetical protein [Nitrosomonadales bacterium]
MLLVVPLHQRIVPSLLGRALG